MDVDHVVSACVIVWILENLQAYFALNVLDICFVTKKVLPTWRLLIYRLPLFHSGCHHGLNEDCFLQEEESQIRTFD